MNKIISKSFLLALFALIASLTSCNSNDDDAIQGTIFSCYATMTSLTDNSVSFSIQKDTKSDPVIITCQQSLNKDPFTIGKRYVIAYTTPTNEPFVGGEATLMAIYGTFSGEVQFESLEEIKKNTNDPISVKFYELVGNWLNITSVANVDKNPNVLGVYVDESTLDNEYPDVYLCFSAENNYNITPVYIYSSYDIAPIQNTATAKGINFHFKDNNSDYTKKLDF